MAKSTPFLDIKKKCAAQHFGPWMVESKWFAQAVSAVKAGTFKPDNRNDSPIDPNPDRDPDDPECEPDEYSAVPTNQTVVAVIHICGPMTKEDSSFGGTNSVRVRKSLRNAAADDSISAILIYIDSPGGTCAGTGDLASDIASINRMYDESNGMRGKPCYTYFEDLGASAAYWVGCQSRRVYANPTAQIGSIGTMTYVEDTSGAYEKAGIKVTLIATGKFKGQWIDGNPVTEDYIKQIQTEIDDLNEHFLAGVMAGRNMSRDQLAEIADGRVFIASKAQQLGLVDEVASIDVTMQAISNEVSAMNAEQVNTYLAEHPEAVAGFVDKGKKAGVAEARTEERKRASELVEAAGGDYELAMTSFITGHEAPTVKLAADTAAKTKNKADADAKAHADALAAKEAEIAKLKDQVAFARGTQGPASTRTPASPPLASPAGADPESSAKAAWAQMSAEDQSAWLSEDAFVKFSMADAKGQIKAAKVRVN